jgi:Eukaryotic protein of unknown function (DUF866)
MFLAGVPDPKLITLSEAWRNVQDFSNLTGSDCNWVILELFTFIIIICQMPIFTLLFKAELENIHRVTFPDDHEWLLDFQSAFSDEKRQDVRVSACQTVEMPNSRAIANVCLSFKETGGSPASISVTGVKDVTRNSYLDQDSGQFVPIVAFECRGAIPIKWSPSGYYVADNISNVDLSNGEWYDVNAVSCESVSITDVQWKFARHPGN